MIKQVKYSFLDRLERDTPRETGFILSVEALTNALRGEWQSKVLQLKDIYSITQQVDLETKIMYFSEPPEDYTTEDSNEYTADGNTI